MFVFFYVVCILFMLTTIKAFRAPVNYSKEGEDDVKSSKNNIPLYVNTLNTEEGILPFEYHHFDFCLSDETHSPVENLGQVVFGDRIRPSPYKIKYMQDESCKVVCSKVYNGSDPESKRKIDIIKMGTSHYYQHHWILDGIPVTWCYYTEGQKSNCSTGFPMGCHVTRNHDSCSGIMYTELNQFGVDYYLFNHVDLEIIYHTGVYDGWGIGYGDNGGRIISAKVKPASINYNNNVNPDCNFVYNPLKLPEILTEEETFTVTYTYRVKFVKNNDIKWSSRWDRVLEAMPQHNIQWFRIVTKFFVIGLVAMILLWKLRKDIARYEQVECEKDAQEEFGWKLLHGDVFRPPRRGMLLAVFLGSGPQVFGTLLATLKYACIRRLGLLPSDYSETLVTCAIVAWVVFGAAAGYVSTRIYKSFRGTRWKSNALLTSTVCPGVVFSLFFIMDWVLRGRGSSAAVPLWTILTLLALWFGVSLPLTFIGAYCGFTTQSLEHPVHTNEYPRQIVDQPWYTRPVIGIIVGGVLPFKCILVEMFFIMNSLWSGQVYNMVNPLILVCVTLVVTCSVSTIVLCYMHLCGEDYHWWWRAFLSSGSTAVYFFLYCCYYFATKLNFDDTASIFLYFGYIFIMSFLLFLLTGIIGFVASFWFVRKIYSVIKVD